MIFEHQRANQLLCALLLSAAFVSGCSRRNRVAEHLERANRFFEHQQFEEARLEYLNVLQVDRNQPVALRGLGQILYDRGEIREAFDVLRAAESGDRANPEIGNRLARLYLVTGQVAPARSAALAVLAKDPANESALICLAMASGKPEEIKQSEEFIHKARTQRGESAVEHTALGLLALNSNDLKSSERELIRALAVDPKASETHLSLAILRWRQNDLKAADQEFKAASDLAPNDWIVRLKWADFALRTGQLDESDRIIADLRKRTPELLPAILLQAKAALAERKYEVSAAAVDQVLKQDPRDLDALLVKAQIALAKGQVLDAISEFETLRDRLPRSAQVAYQLALAYTLNKQQGKAYENAHRAVALDPNFPDAVLLLAELDLQQRNFSSAIDSLSALTTRAPNLIKAYALLAAAYRADGRLAPALDTYQRWRKIAPTAAEPPYLIGLVLREEGKVDEARKAFETSSQLAPDFVPPIEQLVNLDLLAKNPSAALNRVSALIERTPKAPGPHLLLARIHLNENQTKAGETDLKRAIALDPNFNPAYESLAQLYLREGRDLEALAGFQALVAKNPKDPSPLLQLAVLQERTKDFEAARDNYRKVLTLSSNSVQALNNLAYLSAERFNDLPEAYQYVQKARDLAPENGSVADTLGWILCKRGEYAWALAVLHEAANKLPSDPEIQFHLGYAAYMMADEAQARSAFQRALALQKDFTEKGRAERLLETLAIDPRSTDPALQSELKAQIKQNPQDVGALLRLASMQEEQRDIEGAAVSYRQAAKASPKSAIILSKLAWFYVGNGHDFTRGLAEAKAARALAPGDPTVARVLGRCALAAKDYDLAYRTLQEALRQHSNDSSILADLANAAYFRGHASEAVDLGKRALSTTSLFAEAAALKRMLDLIEASQDPHRAELADTQALEILRKEPGDIPALMVHGTALERRGEARAAIDVYERVLQDDPDFAPASRRLAPLYANPTVAEDRKALASGLKARVVFADDTGLSVLLGAVAFRLKDYSRAVEFLKEGIREDPRDPELYFKLGMSFRALQRKRESVDALRKALDLKLEGSKAEEARHVLAEGQ